MRISLQLRSKQATLLCDCRWITCCWDAKPELELAVVKRELDLAAVTRELDLAAVEREVDQTSPALRKREPLIVEAAERQLKLLLRMRFSFEHFTALSPKVY